MRSLMFRLFTIHAIKCSLNVTVLWPMYEVVFVMYVVAPHVFLLVFRVLFCVFLPLLPSQIIQISCPCNFIIHSVLLCVIQSISIGIYFFPETLVFAHYYLYNCHYQNAVMSLNIIHLNSIHPVIPVPFY
eukprot:515626_1